MRSIPPPKFTFLDFFAGAGLVSEALKGVFRPVWANDICPRKASIHIANHGEDHFHCGPVQEARGVDLPRASLAWASFPCQDLSLAGTMKGISSSRSGLVWEWLRILDEMPAPPPVITAENVTGLVSADEGRHYQRLHTALTERGYQVGALVLDARHWTPQSRPRVFVVGTYKGVPLGRLAMDHPSPWSHSPAIQRAAKDLESHVWWRLPKPPPMMRRVESVVDWEAPFDSEFRSEANLRLIPPKHWERMMDCIERGDRVFPGYRRMREGRQVMELRFDGLAGCLRTPGGGSSKQFLVTYTNAGIRVRLLTVREAARLMGLPEYYYLPDSYNDGYKAMGDAVCVPAVRYLAEHLLRPLAVLAAESTSICECDPKQKIALNE